MVEKSKLIGKTIGHLFVLSKDEEKSKNKGFAHYLVRCECGKEFTVAEDKLLRKNPQHSCGCKTGKYIRDRHLKDISGKKYGLLTVIEFDHCEGGSAYWVCQCDCGNITTVNGTLLRVGRRKSCGCSRSKTLTKEITGKKIGKLQVIERAGSYCMPCGAKLAAWKCLCDCGKEVIVTGTK